MRAKKVYEFKQGQNPYKTMELGANSPIVEGSKFQCIQDIFYEGDWQPGSFHPRTNTIREFFRKGDNHKIIEINGRHYKDLNYQMDNPMQSHVGLKDLKMYFKRI
jgi:hypothetical protein